MDEHRAQTHRRTIRIKFPPDSRSRKRNSGCGNLFFRKKRYLCRTKASAEGARRNAGLSDARGNAKALKPLIYTPNSYIVELTIGGKTEKAVMREVQFHPVREEILHIDFYRVQEGKPVAISIPVRLTGNAEGVKVGGKLVLSTRKIFVSGPVDKLPDEITVDVTTLGVGKTIFVGDLKSDDLKFLTPATTAVCAVRVTRASRGAAAEAAQ